MHHMADIDSLSQHTQVAQLFITTPVRPRDKNRNFYVHLKGRPSENLSQRQRQRQRQRDVGGNRPKFPTLQRFINDFFFLYKNNQNRFFFSFF